MCRINGIWDLNHRISSNLTSIGISLRDKLKHGGPDDAGSFVDISQSIFLGHRRLSILDLSVAGHQPMEYGKYIIVYNGEVYNFKEVRNELIGAGISFTSETDTEVILKAFANWGYDGVKKFRGMFAFAIWNKSTQKLVLCRDRLGVKPLYYYFKDGLLIFASELKGITSFPDIDLTIDQAAVSRYLQVGYIKSPHSIYKWVKKVEPGNILEIESSGKMSTAKYWSIANIEFINSNVSDNAILEQAEHLLVENCNYRMIADVPVGVFLSGGVDSSLVTALIKKSSSNPVKTFSIGFEQQEFNEAEYAKGVAQYLQTDHHEWILSNKDFLNALDKVYQIYDEPFGDSSSIPTYLVSLFAKSKVSVALSADGGDEIFGGYDRYQYTKDVFPKIQNMPLQLRKICMKLLSLNLPITQKLLIKLARVKYGSSADWRIPKIINSLSAISFFDFYQQSQTVISPSLLSKLHMAKAVYSLAEEECFFNEENIFSSLGKIDLLSYLEGDILTKVDRATMSVALEGREPLLDHTLVEFGLSLPDKFKRRDGRNKWVLRTLLEQQVPSSLVNRPKKGFAVPIKQWMNLLLKNELLEMSEDTVFINRFQLSSKTLTQIVDSFFKDKQLINPHLMWNLQMLHKWHQQSKNYA